MCGFRFARVSHRLGVSITGLLLLVALAALAMARQLREIGATGAQSQDTGQINVAVTQLDQMKHQNAALVQRSAAAAQGLRDQAGDLASVVATFKLKA